MPGAEYSVRLRAGLAAAILLAAAPGAAAPCPDGAIRAWLAELRASYARAQRAAYQVDLPAPGCRAALLLLTDAAHDPQARVRGQAVRLLGEIEAPSAGVTRLLLRALAEDQDVQVRAHAAMGLRRHGKGALPHLVAAAHHSGSHAADSPWWYGVHAADEAATVLVQIGGEAVPAIIDGVDRGVLSQAEAMAILEWMEGDIVAVLLAAAERATSETRIWIVSEALSRIEYVHERRDGYAAEAARTEAPGLSISGDDDFGPHHERPDDAGSICQAFGRLLSMEDVRAHVLREGLECSVIARAAEGRLEITDVDGTTELMERAPETIVASMVAKIARGFRRGEVPEEAFSAYLETIHGRGGETVLRNALAEHLVPLLRADLRDERPVRRERAATYLGYWHAARATPDLLAALSDSDETVRAAAARSLRFDAAAPPAGVEAALVLLLSDPERDVRIAAAGTLASYRPLTAKTLDAVAGLLPEAPEDDRWFLVRIIVEGAPSSTAALRLLVPFMLTEIGCPAIGSALAESSLVPAPDLLAMLDEAVRGCERSAPDLVLFMARGGAAAEPRLVGYAHRARSAAQAPAIAALAAIGSDHLPAARQAAFLKGSPEAFIAALLALRSDAPDEEVRLVASVLDGLSDFSAPPLPPHPLRPPTQEERIVEALRRIGRRGQEAAPAVRRYLERQEEPSRETVATLFAIAPDARSVAALELAFAALHSRYAEQYAEEKFVEMLADIPDLAHEWLLPLLRNRERLTVLMALDILARSVPPPEVVPYVLPLLTQPDAEIREEAARLLGSFARDPGVRDALTCRALDPARSVRLGAARALADGRDDLPPEIETILAEQFVTDELSYGIRRVIASALHVGLPDAPLSPAPTIAPPGDATPPVPRMPAWPLPPPLWSAYDTIPSAVLGKADDTLEEVHARLAGTLRRLGYATQGIFAAPGGFALMTMVERIHADGRPYRVPARWTTSRLRPRNLREYLEILLVEKPGRFRVFVFVITPQPSLGTPSGQLTESRAETLMDAAYRILPPAIASQRYAGRICHVLVYTLEKKAGRRAKVVRNDPLLLPGHLRGAGIAASLGLVPRR